MIRKVVWVGKKLYSMIIFDSCKYSMYYINYRLFYECLIIKIMFKIGSCFRYEKKKKKINNYISNMQPSI